MTRLWTEPRRTRLIATIGPASVGRLDELVSAGLDVARINLSHGSPEEHHLATGAVRAAGATAGREIGILVDLPGPKVRLGAIDGDTIELLSGASVVLTGERSMLSSTDVMLPLAEVAAIAGLRQGDRILLADGAAELRVSGHPADGGVRAVVNRGGLIRSRAGVNVPAERLTADTLNAADDAYLPHLLELAPDYVGQSFVRTAAEVDALRSRLPDEMRIVAKIETRPAVEGIDAILEVADAIMVARGDLGVELPFESVPLIQKDIVRAALAAGRPSIVATQMLESMVDAARPTRAEASDVANAILDGTDAVMLSAETAIGAYPVEALRAAGAIATATDGYAGFGAGGFPGTADFETDPDARATAMAAVTLAANDADVVALACFTRTGRTARLLSALRPSVPIVALTASAVVARQLALVRGVRSFAIDAGDGEVSVASIITSLWQETPGPKVRDPAVVIARTRANGGPNQLEVVRLASH